MTSAQEARADGWQRDTAQRNATVAGLARENRQLREQLGHAAELAAVLAAWVEHLPVRHVPVRAGLALAELQRITRKDTP